MLILKTAVRPAVLSSLETASSVLLMWNIQRQVCAHGRIIASIHAVSDSDESSGGNGALCKLLTDPGWKQKLQNEFTAPYFKTLETTLEKEFKTAEVFPPKELIFNAFNTTPFDKVGTTHFFFRVYTFTAQAQPYLKFVQLYFTCR